MTNQSEIIQAITYLIEMLEALEIPYYVGGSVASNVFGNARTTLDADLVADIQLSHVRPLVNALSSDYYIDADMIRDAIRRKGSFNIIYLDKMLKIDIFIPKATPFAQQERQHARPVVIEEGTRPFYFASPEDTILNKLVWYKMGNGVSTRQWNDILGVLNRQQNALDFPYMHHWAKQLGVTNLLTKALADVGLPDASQDWEKE